MNPFDVLEIRPDASPEDIKAAYHRLAKQWHPDRYTGDAKVEAEEKFRELAEAFSTLKDPGKRREMGKAAKDRAKREYSLDVWMKRQRKLYQDVIGSGEFQSS